MWHKSNYQKQLESCSRKMAQQVSVLHTSRITHTGAQNPCKESLLVIMCNLWSLHSCSSVGGVERKENNILWAARMLTKDNTNNDKGPTSTSWKQNPTPDCCLLAPQTCYDIHLSILTYIHPCMHTYIHTYRKQENWRKEESGIISSLPIEWLWCLGAIEG